MEAHVAFLRGINLAGRNRLPMKDLAAMFSKAGCESVATYIQSGNVVFRASPALARGIPDLIEKAISKSFGYQVPVVTRTGGEMRKIVRANPFLRAGADEAALHVAFLTARPAAARVEALDPDRSPPDAFAVRGREIYLHCPNGYGRSKLTNGYFDSKLATMSTVRNWRTVLELLELASG
ncbi:MAG TPA: DUF1697 domain-containing protein [Vicinamibacteria bacterium]|jgi:uncharacterized protein (DUF1697 family)